MDGTPHEKTKKEKAEGLVDFFDERFKQTDPLG